MALLVEVIFFFLTSYNREIICLCIRIERPCIATVPLRGPEKENRGRQTETCAQETGRQTHRQKDMERFRRREEIGKKEEK